MTVQCQSTEPQLLAGLWVLMQCKIMVSDVQNCNERSKRGTKMVSFSHYVPFLVCWRDSLLLSLDICLL